MKKFLMRLCKIASNLFMLEEIIKQTIFVLIYGITNTVIRLVALPFNYLISGLIGVANGQMNKGNIIVKNYKGFIKVYRRLNR